MPEPPQYFALMCTRFLGCSPSLATELWTAYGEAFPGQVTSLRFALDRLTGETAPAPLEIVKQRLRHASTMLRPATLMAVSLRLSPEGRRGRRRDVVRFEEKLLAHVAANGDWL